MAAKGLPGKLTTTVLPMFPTMVGRPGLMSILSMSTSIPRLVNASLVKSLSPTDTPPEVMMISASSVACIEDSNASRVSAEVRMNLTSQPSALERVKNIGELEL